MNRRLRIRLLAVALLAGVLAQASWAQDSGAQAAPAAAASAAVQAWGPVQPTSQCLDPAAVDRWHRLDERTVLAATRGGGYFELRFADACASSTRPSAWQMSAQAPGRLCGFAGEVAVDAEGNLCRIAGLRRLDRAQFDALEKRER